MSRSCHLICGEDDFRVEQAARRLVERLVPPENRAFGLEVVDGRVETADACAAAIRRCLESVATDSLFGGGAKLTWLREPAFLTNDRLARSEVVRRGVAGLTARIKAGLPEGQSLLVTTLKVHRGSDFFKAFQSAGEVQEIFTGRRQGQREAAARQLLAEWLPRIGLKMNAAAQANFLARVGTDSRLLIGELHKLGCYCGPGAEATEQDIREVASPGKESEVWELLDAFGNRDATATVAQLRRQFARFENPIGLTAMLETRVRALLVLREALDRSWAVACEGGEGLDWRRLPAEVAAWFETADDFRKYHPFRLSCLAAQAGKWTLHELRRARHILLELREELVSSGLPPECLAEMRLLAAMARRQPARKRGTAAGKTAGRVSA
jgi:DNA polymerase-3 subunit delta